MSTTKVFNNVYAIPVASFGETLGSRLRIFRIAAQHTPWATDNLMEQASYHPNDIEFVSGAETFLKELADTNINAAIDYAEEAIRFVYRDTYYSLMLSELLLDCAQRTFDLQDMGYQDESGNVIDFHRQAIGLVERVCPYVNTSQSAEQEATLQRAIDIVIRFSHDTEDRFDAVHAISVAMDYEEGPMRKAILAHQMCKKCIDVSKISADFALRNFHDAIDELADDDEIIVEAIACWQDCIKNVDNGMSQAGFSKEMAFNKSFIAGIDEVLNELQRMHKPPELQLVKG